MSSSSHTFGARRQSVLQLWATRVLSALSITLLVGQLLGCALTGKADLIGIRYFEPEAPHPNPSARAPLAPGAAPIELQIGRVTASAYLKSRLVYRTSKLELGAYDDRQWTERPEEYLRRYASAALFEGRGLEHALSGDAPMLDLELAAFEEIHIGDKSTARVQIRYVLHDEHSVWSTDTITVEKPTRGGSQNAEDVVEAMSEALASATTTLADEVEARLRQPPVETAPPPN